MPAGPETHKVTAPAALFKIQTFFIRIIIKKKRHSIGETRALQTFRMQGHRLYSNRIVRNFRGHAVGLKYRIYLRFRHLSKKRLPVYENDNTTVYVFLCQCLVSLRTDSFG